MKKVRLALALSILIYACQFSGKNNTAITGTYVRTNENEISIVYDTLNIAPVNDQAKNVFLITERSQAIFKKAEDRGFNKRNNRTITGTYEPENNIMRTPDPGILYSFDPKERTLSINTIVYKKIE